ncbi:MAG: general secretion pathway protein GspN, partial [Arenimonas sp.]|uniref:general secretion pathway protein GspN n=1 Tax=Arenimonas sp. TaxID=1872635 RepID=UPI0025BCD90C
MVSALRPAGALLAAVAAWALCLAVLAVLGLGGRVGPHPADGALMPALPVVTLDAVGSRLGPASDYLEVGNRPLFGRDRRPAPMSAPSGDRAAPLDVNLTSVLITAGLKLAIVQNTADGASRRVRLGDVLEGTAWRLVQLEPRRAVFEGPEGQRELALRVFDGAGGQSPTPMAGSGVGGPLPVPAGAPAPHQPDVAPRAPPAPPTPRPRAAQVTPAVAPGPPPP